MTLLDPGRDRINERENSMSPGTVKVDSEEGLESKFIG